MFSFSELSLTSLYSKTMYLFFNKILKPTHKATYSLQTRPVSARRTLHQTPVRRVVFQCSLVQELSLS